MGGQSPLPTGPTLNPEICTNPMINVKNTRGGCRETSAVNIHILWFLVSCVSFWLFSLEECYFVKVWLLCGVMQETGTGDTLNLCCASQLLYALVPHLTRAPPLWGTQTPNFARSSTSASRRCHCMNWSVFVVFVVMILCVCGSSVWTCCDEGVVLCAMIMANGYFLCANNCGCQVKLEFQSSKNVDPVF